MLLAIDIGTSACKTALFGPDGTVAAQATAPYPVHYPRPGWAEQNPDDWWDAVCGCIREMLEADEVDARAIAGIGIDGQSWSAIPVDGDGKVLHNTPIWMDTRADGICRELDRTLGGERLFRVCGNPLQPTYTLPKILWYRAEAPEVYAGADKILQSNGYIVYRLTGAMTQDICQGYGYHCFDMRRGKWDDALCAELGLRRDLLPDIAPCHEIVGRVSGEAAAACGLPAGIPVVAGGLDAACGALGTGVLHQGETQEQGGQAGGMSICTETCHADPRLILSFHVVPDRWLLQGGSVGGGGILRWMEAELGAAERETAARNGTTSMREMDNLAAAVPPGSDGLAFLPYMAGERSPLWDPSAKGVFYGLDYSKTRGHMIRAALEGVAYALRHNLETAEESGVTAIRLRSMGGAANSRLWTQMKADITGKGIDVPGSETATTLGAAMLAGVAVGVYRDFDEAVARTVAVTRTHEPDRDVKATYDDGYRLYRSLYDSLKPLMKGERTL